MTEIKKLPKEIFSSNNERQKQNIQKLETGYNSEKDGIFSEDIFLGKVSAAQKKYNKLSTKIESQTEQKELIDAFGGIKTLHGLFDINGDGKVTKEELSEIADLNTEDITVDTNKTVLSTKDLRSIYEDVMDIHKQEEPVLPALNKAELSLTEAEILEDSNDIQPSISTKDIIDLKDKTLDDKKAYMDAPVGTKKEVNAQIKYVDSVITWANTILNKSDATEYELKSVISEMSFIQKYQSPAVKDTVKESKQVLSELNSRLAELVAQKNATLVAKRAYMNAPVGSKKEVNTQINYVNTVINWANTILNKPDATQEEFENVIKEMTFIQKYQSAAVKDIVASSKPILEELNTKYNKLIEPKKQAIQKQLDGVFDETSATKLAKSSQQRAGKRTESTSKCAQYVRLALEDAELLGREELVVSSAKDLKTKYLTTGVFSEININSIDDLKLLPPGCIIVWQNGEGFGSEFAKHGHVAITQKDGKATTDYNQLIKDYGTSFNVFVPTLKTSEQKSQDAKDAKAEFEKNKVSIASTSKYLNRCITYAESVISDKNTTEETVKDTIQMLSDVVKVNKFANLRPMVKTAQNLLTQLKSKKFN